MRFSKLQNRHETLLEIESKGQDINAEIRSFIKQAQQEAANYSPEERDNLRAILRHWAAYIFEKTGNYPDTELVPMVKPNFVSLFLQNASTWLFATLIIILCFGGILITPRIVSVVVQSSTPAFPQIVINDSGGFTLLLFMVAILLLISLIVMRRRMSLLVSGVGARVSLVTEGIRKTMIGSGKRGKPIAILRITDGPQAMIGQELKIFTESVKLGRDPQRADITFYTPDTNSSISGLHTRIERKDGTWYIIAISHSGSETFVDNYPIPFNEPHHLQNSQTVRLGYMGQQPVIFTFSTMPIDTPVRTTEFDYRKTDISNEVIGESLIKKREGDSSKPIDNVDDVFNEFKDRE